MENGFNEHLVRRLPQPADNLKKLGVMAVGVAVMAMSFVFLGILSIIIAAGVLTGTFFIFRNFEIEFEYILTDGQLDIDRIVARERRKSVVKVEVDTFDVFAPFNDEFYPDSPNFNPDVTLDVSSSPKSPRLWYATFRQEGKKHLLIFEPTERMRKEIKQVIPRRVKGFK